MKSGRAGSKPIRGTEKQIKELNLMEGEGVALFLTCYSWQSEILQITSNVIADMGSKRETNNMDIIASRIPNAFHQLSHTFTHMSSIVHRTHVTGTQCEYTPVHIEDIVLSSMSVLWKEREKQQRKRERWRDIKEFCILLDECILEQTMKQERERDGGYKGVFYSPR